MTATISKSYLAQRIDEQAKLADEAFSNLMKIIPVDIQSEVIKYYVDATFAEYWRGWYSARAAE